MITAICIGGPLAGQTVSRPDGCQSFRSTTPPPPRRSAFSDRPAENVQVDVVIYRLRAMQHGVAWVAQ